jgi:ABC-2 type transport system permease protein
MASLVAREESTGRLDLVVSTGRLRRNILGEKSAAVFALMGVIVVILTVIVVVGNAQYDTGIPLINMVAATVGLGMLGLCFWGIAVAFWSFAPGAAIGGTAAIAVFAYLVNGLGAIVDVLAPVRWLSPFYWYLGDTVPLNKGVTWGYLALAVVAIAGTVVATARFRTRDLAA